MTRIVRFHEEGGPEVLKLEEVDLGPPGPGEVSIRIEAIGLNRAEAMFRSGTYYERPARWPAVLGYEAAGTVESVGRGVDGFAAGDAVSVVPSFSMRDHGVYAERVVLPASSLVRRPPGQDAVAGAAVWMSGVTAYGGLVEVGQLRAGDTVLITAATGSIGVAAIQVANRVGAVSIATTRNPRKRELLLEAGATHVVIAGAEDLVERVRDVTGGRGADVVFDPVAGKGVSELAAATAAHGKLILYGMLGWEAQRPGAFWSDGLGATPFPITNWSCTMRWYAAMDTTRDPERLRRAAQFVLSGLRSGALRAIVDRTFDLDDIVAAHRHLESSAQFGKVVVTVG